VVRAFPHGAKRFGFAFAGGFFRGETPLLSRPLLRGDPGDQGIQLCLRFFALRCLRMVPSEKVEVMPRGACRASWEGIVDLSCESLGCITERLELSVGGLQLGACGFELVAEASDLSGQGGYPDRKREEHQNDKREDTQDLESRACGRAAHCSPSQSLSISPVPGNITAACDTKSRRGRSVGPKGRRTLVGGYGAVPAAG